MDVPKVKVALHLKDRSAEDKNRHRETIPQSGEKVDEGMQVGSQPGF